MNSDNVKIRSQSARNSILEKLNQAQVTPMVKEALEYQPWGHVEPPTQVEKTDRFIACMEANHTEIKRILKSELDVTIQAIVADKAFKTAAIGTAGEYHQSFVRGLDKLETTLFDKAIEEWKTELFENVDVGVTHVLAGIADTGALVLWPSIEEPRTLSLVPPCHIAVIEESMIMSNFSEVMATQNWTNSIPTNALLISGPSKTADIQQTLAYGAHGPSELVVLIIKDVL
jgi:L-lactate dehydrogenase complex protein LldG